MNHQNRNRDIYPGSTPEFRILRKKSGEQEIQVRYVNITVGYTGQWSSIPIVDESDNKSNIG
jgi:hypothetical protein